MFRILHVSDLHARCDREWILNSIWRAAKETLLKECEDNNVDVVAFTGDVAFKGIEEEYRLAEAWIGDCLTSSNGLNLATKQLLFVPGNHDVDRLQIDLMCTATEEQLKTVVDQEDVAKYFNDDDTRARLFRRHAAYEDFVSRIRGESRSHLPAWSQVFDFHGSKILFDGFTSSWLCRGADDHRRLLIGQPQLTDRLNQRPDDTAVAIAMFHHPIADLMEFDERSTEMSLRDHYDIVLRGHLHDADAIQRETRNGGYLELPAGAFYEREKYPNGFSIIDVSDDLSSVQVKPFVWHSGRWIHDRNLYPDSEDGLGRFRLRSSRSQQPKKKASTPSILIRSESEGVADVDEILPDFPRFKQEPRAQDQVIRERQQEQALWLLQNSRLLEVWSEWGAHAMGFVASVVAKFKATHMNITVLHAGCSGASTGNELQESLELAAQVSLPQVGSVLQSMGQHRPVLIVLDDVELAEAASKDATPTIPETVKAILEYCENVHLLVTASGKTKTAVCGEEYLQIEPLDSADTRSYMNQHSSRKVELESVVDYDRVHRCTGGLPHHVDSVVEALTYTSLSGALADFDAIETESVDDLPKIVLREIEELGASSDPQRVDAYAMLGLLCILENGESLRVIKRVLPQTTLWLSHARVLQDAGLLDVVEGSVTQDFSTYGRHGESQEKLLRVPRAVRDRVRQILSRDRRIELLKAAAVAYFGSDWKTGAIRMSRMRLRSLWSNQHSGGNELGILYEICSMALHGKADAPCNRTEAVTLMLKYVHHLSNKGLYGECYAASRELLGMLEHVGVNDYPVEIAEINLVAGKAARMIGERTAALTLLNSALATARRSQDKGRVADVLLSTALTHEGLGHEHEAREAATEVISLSDTYSSDYIQAKAIIAGFEADGSEKVATLRRLENKARAKEHFVVADNIALELATMTNDVEQTLQHLARVKARGTLEYNYVRATIRRVETLLDNGRFHRITEVDLHELNQSYSIAYFQRMKGIFNWCHRVVWHYYERVGNQKSLHELFRHSSFIWRLNGDKESEKKYAEMIATNRDTQLEGSKVQALLRYCMTRIDTLVSPKSEIPLKPKVIGNSENRHGANRR